MKNPGTRCAALLTPVCFALACVTTAQGADIEDAPWSVDRRHRLLVTVAPIDLGDRARDELVAAITIDFDRFLEGRLPDLSSLTVVQIDPESGRVIDYPHNAVADEPGELPMRFYDASVPWKFPDYYDYVNFEAPRRRGRFNTIEGGGRFYGAIGEGRAGRLAWAAPQAHARPARYAIYFDALPEGAEPRRAPEGFVGDGGPRCERISNEFAPVIHGRVATGDFNGDGLFDVVLGHASGTLLYHVNAGTAGSPRFTAAALLTQVDGGIIDVGWSSAPAAADWDGDGDLDLVVGAEKEALLLYRNVGAGSGNPVFERVGLLSEEGRPIRTPRQPCAEDPTNSIYPVDYYPVPEIVDWDGDGDLDVLAGGYITGTIAYYENVAEPPDVEPRLVSRGHLQTADGKTLDVGWCAAPAAADFDGDGDLDLVSGAMQMTEIGGDKGDSDRFLFYFENIGDTGPPRLQPRPFPRRGRFSYGALGSPRAVDFNDDDLLDLVVSVQGSLLLLANVGEAGAPRFDAGAAPVPAPWGRSSIYHTQMVDYNDDGWPDLFVGGAVLLNDGKGAPGTFSRRVAFGGADAIHHPSVSGDHWDYRHLCDLDGDGDLDVLLGDHGGHVWFHENTGPVEAPRLDPQGVKLKLASGQPIRVGIHSETSAAFDMLQGARTTVTSLDHDRDGRIDLALGDTYGAIRVFAREPGSSLAFADPIELETAHDIRVYVQSFDWNRDGAPDLLASYASGPSYVYINRSARTQGEPFAKAEPLDLPPGIGEPLVTVKDWNRDGDEDFIIQDYSYMRFAERSFVERGYIEAKVGGFQSRSGDPDRIP